MELNVVYESDNSSDLFDFVPDPIVLHIFNKVSDIKTLTRCRSVSKRFNSLAVQSDSLLLRVDRVVPATDSGDEDSVLLVFFRSIFKSFSCFAPPKKEEPVFTNPTRNDNSPVRILGGFESVRSLEIEPPSGDLKLDNGSNIKWKEDGVEGRNKGGAAERGRRRKKRERKGKKKTGLGRREERRKKKKKRGGGGIFVIKKGDDFL